MRFITEPSLKLFILISVALHLTAGVALFLLTQEKKPPPKETPYIVRLVPVEPPSPPLEERPPEVLKGGPVPRSPAAKQPRLLPPPRKPAAKAPKIYPQPKPQARVAPEEKKQEAGLKEAKGTVPQEKEELLDKGAAPEARAEGPGKLPVKGKGETGGREESPGRERLFDKDVLSGVIAKGKSPSEKDSSITFDTQEIRYYSYMRKLKERIEAVWEYPRKEAEEGIYGDLVVRFVIKKDGSLGSVELVRTSGWAMLDKAAIAALRDGSPYWPLPEEWGTDSLTVTGHFVYTLYGYYYVR